MSVEKKIKELLERVDAKASLEEAGEMGASGVSKDSSIKSSTSGDSGNPKQGDSKEATFETRDEKEANQGAQVSKGVKKNDIQMKAPPGQAPNFTTVADPASAVNQGSSAGNVYKEDEDLEDEEVIAEDEVAEEDTEIVAEEEAEEAEESEETISEEEATEEPASKEIDLSPIFGEDLSEEFKAKATSIFEAAVIARVNDEIDQITEALAEKFEEEAENYKASVVEKVDAYLSYVVENWMEENKLAIENGLRTEIAEDFMAGLKVLFKEHYIEVPEEKYDVIGELQAKVTDLEENLNSQISNNVELNTEVTDLKKRLIIKEMSKDLAETEVAKLNKLLEGVDFENDDLYKNKVAVIKENYFSKDDEEVKSSQTLVEETGVQEDYSTDSVVSSYAKALSRSIRK
jgi:regulator of replication initiation timing